MMGQIFRVIAAVMVLLVPLAFLGVPGCAVPSSADGTDGAQRRAGGATSMRTIIVGSEAAGHYVALEDGRLVGWNGTTFSYAPGDMVAWVACDYHGQPSVAVINSVHNTWAWTGGAWTQLSTGGDQLIGSQTYVPGANFVLRLDGTKIVGWDGTTFSYPTPSGGVLAWAACDYKGHPSVAVTNDAHNTLAWTGGSWTVLTTCGGSVNACGILSDECEPGETADKCGVFGGHNACLGCDGVPYSGKTRDVCGVCDGHNACVGCDGIPNSGKTPDKCNVCGGDNSEEGCDGVCYSGKTLDECGVCGGDNSEKGCDGVCYSGKTLDECGVCDGDNSEEGCDGVCYSGKTLDECGVCGGDGSTCASDGDQDDDGDQDSEARSARRVTSPERSARP
jgi:hypothetical protein